MNKPIRNWLDKDELIRRREGADAFSPLVQKRVIKVRVPVDLGHHIVRRTVENINAGKKH